jgi:hypothetical protein
MTHASMTVKEPIHLMGPKGEIIATLSPFNDGNGIAIEFEYEKVEIKACFKGKCYDIDGEPESLTVNLLE